MQLTMCAFFQIKILLRGKNKKTFHWIRFVLSKWDHFRKKFIMNIINLVWKNILCSRKQCVFVCLCIVVITRFSCKDNLEEYRKRNQWKRRKSEENRIKSVSKEWSNISRHQYMLLTFCHSRLRLFVCWSIKPKPKLPFLSCAIVGFFHILFWLAY